MDNIVLVTGGAGFIGSHLVDALVAAGRRVRILDNLDPQVHGAAGKVPGYLNRAAEFIQGDVRHLETVAQVLEGVGEVFHFAAAVGVGQSMYEIRRYSDVNVMGTATLLEAVVARRSQVHKLIVASSMSIYGEGAYECTCCERITPPIRSEEQLSRYDWEVKCPQCGKNSSPVPTNEHKQLSPTSVYAISKRDQEEMVLTVCRAYKIPAVALRFFNVYGPRQAMSNPYTGVAAIFSAQITNGAAPLIFEDGRQTRDFISVHDVVQASLLALRIPRMGYYEAFNVGTGMPTSVLDLAQLLGKLYHSSVSPEIVGSFRSGDIRHCYADISRLSKFGYRPQVSLQQGLQELVEWGIHEQASDRVMQAYKQLEERGLIKQ